MLPEVQQDPSEVVLLRRVLEYFSLFLIKRILIWAEASEALSGGIKGKGRAQTLMHPQ